ncbi:MAG: hypothetical protein ABJH28_05180 [Paraglaciecola sp.]|uniref:hypothetical protein n=1 Tax=Paraglaciecola sp. TaxID=1920173 RepID=UPI0032646922
MTPQEIFLFVPEAIYTFGLSLFEVSTLGYGVDMCCSLVIALVFWLKVAEGVLAIIKKVLGIQPRRPF